MAAEPAPALGPSRGHAKRPFDPHLRIPPLQHPLAVGDGARPAPLEPQAHAIVTEAAHRPAAKLTSRSAAREDVRPLGDEEEQEEEAARSPFRTARVTTTLHGAARTDAEGAVRKKQKVEIFQLPKPQAKPRANKPPPFEPIRVLTGLNEPPPSAGLFPPITPTGLRDVEPSTAPSEPGSPSTPMATSKPAPATAGARTSKEMPPSSPAEIKPKAKRKCLRGRLKWTESETQDLLTGVGIYGVGKWKKILTHPAFAFHPDRTMVDLKDRYRTCRMNEEKAIERKAVEEIARRAYAQRRSSDRSRPSSSPHGHGSSSSGVPTSQPASDDGRRDGGAPTEPLFDITTTTTYEESLQSARPRKGGAANPWTSDEDASLSRGYHKYGFQWTAIAKDASLGLLHRTGAQVRDRFRMKYPIVYQSSVPLPLPAAPSAGRAPRRTRRRSHSGDGHHRSQPTLLAHETETPAPAPAPPSSKRRARPILPAIQPPLEHSVPSLSSQASSPGTPAVILPDRFSGLVVQQLPDPDADLGGGGGGGSLAAASSPAASSERDADQEPPAADAEEFRHLSILGLLNEDTESSGRLPSFKYSMDDWDGPGGSDGSVTLPPLLSWDEMTNKPMFDLE